MTRAIVKPFDAFCDADVLIASLTRSMLLFASQIGAPFRLRWSRMAEAEADRHTRPPRSKVSDLRVKSDWGDKTLVKPAADDRMSELVDTQLKDRHIIAAAHQAKIPIIVTRNVSDFGTADLKRWHMSAVHPDAFATVMIVAPVYRELLITLAHHRSQPPNDPSSIHAAIGKEHPTLFRAMEELFPGVVADLGSNDPPKYLHRGQCCYLCGRDFESDQVSYLGVHSDCMSAIADCTVLNSAKWTVY
ncbi:MAG: hypothetical protein LBV30_05500 [Propionibacteriaceae bacterium]|nr:hypothetical protein [Propionibacteriaceae bacterium]